MLEPNKYRFVYSTISQIGKYSYLYLKMAYLNEIIIKLCIGGYFDWLPDKIYLKIFFRSRLGYKLNLKHPKTFNEKIQWLKLYDRNPLYSKLSDKYEVRDFVARTIGAKYLKSAGCLDKIDKGIKAVFGGEI